MGAILDALHRLQQLELELLTLKNKINAKHRAVRAGTARVKQIDQDIAAKRDQLKHEQAAADRAELDRKSRDVEIARLREALNKAKTNKEYAALLTQINTDKADNSKLEERVLQLYGSVDQIKKSLQELEETRAQETERLKGAQAAAAEFEGSLKDQVATLESQRKQAMVGIPAPSLQLFARVLERHDGEAMAALTQVSPKREDFICGGCNMGVPLDRVNSLQTRDEIEMCPSCGRILYLDQTMPARR